MPRECKLCGNSFLTSVVIDGKRRNTGSRKYCLECSPFGCHNTTDLFDRLHSKPGFQICSDCRLQLPLSEFGTQKNGKSIRRKCKQCMKRYFHKKVKRLKVEAVGYKGGKCEECGYDKCLNALQFHHIDPAQKEFNLSTFRGEFSAMKTELDKCRLLCANCHAEFHAVKEEDL